MRPFAIIQHHYDPRSELYHLLVVHSVLVARQAARIAQDYLERHPGAPIDLELLGEAALLHDIGIKRCRAPAILCSGEEPYVRHGIIGAQMLLEEGLPRHALVCERHTGAGIAKEEVIARNLPLPARDYLPVSLEEKIVCIADKFFSKTPAKVWQKKKREKITKSLAKHGTAVLKRWIALSEEILDR